MLSIDFMYRVAYDFYITLYDLFITVYLQILSQDKKNQNFKKTFSFVVFPDISLILLDYFACLLPNCSSLRPQL